MVLTNTQRIEGLEEKLAEVESKLDSIDGKLTTQEAALSRVISEAVSKAMEEAQQTMKDQLATLWEEERRRRPPPFVQLDVENSHTRGNDEGRPPGGWRRVGGEEHIAETHNDDDRTGRWKYKRVEMPTFDGKEPDNWVMRAKMFFEFNRLTEDERVTAAVVALDGPALQWYHWENRRRPFEDWPDLRARILREFRPSHTGTLQEQWLAVSQTSTVAEYRRKFIELIFPLEEIPESLMKAQFINGLNEDIKAELRLLDPSTLDRAMDLAGRIEERNRVQGGKKGGGLWRVGSGPSTSGLPVSDIKKGGGGLISTYGLPSNNGPMRTWNRPTESQGSVNLNRPNTSQQSKATVGPRRLTEAELQEKRAKGLCFCCDERWSAGHRCKRKELSVLIVADEETEGGEVGDEEEQEEEPMEVSLCSVVGLSHPKTMKLKGEVHGCEVVVMIDPGATHNFLSLRVIEKTGLPVRGGGDFEVSLGNGESVRGHGVCKEVEVKLAG